MATEQRLKHAVTELLPRHRVALPLWRSHHVFPAICPLVGLLSCRTAACVLRVGLAAGRTLSESSGTERRSPPGRSQKQWEERHASLHIGTPVTRSYKETSSLYFAKQQRTKGRLPEQAKPHQSWSPSTNLTSKQTERKRLTEKWTDKDKLPLITTAFTIHTVNVWSILSR